MPAIQALWVSGASVVAFCFHTTRSRRPDMIEEKDIKPYLMGVSAALVLIGKALASTPGIDVGELIAAAKHLQAAMPEEPKSADGQGVHQAALSSLLAGIGAAQQ